MSCFRIGYDFLIGLLESIQHHFFQYIYFFATQPNVFILFQEFLRSLFIKYGIHAFYVLITLAVVRQKPADISGVTRLAESR